MIENIIAIIVCCTLGGVVLFPIIKHVIKVESYDDTKWYTTKKKVK